MRTSVSLLPIAWMAALLSTSCSSPTEPDEDQDQALSKVTVDGPAEYVLLVGETIQLFSSAFISHWHECPDTDGGQHFCRSGQHLHEVDADLRWESSDTLVVTVTEGPGGSDGQPSGVVRGVSAGTATISVTAGELRSQPVLITVARGFVPLVSVVAGGLNTCALSADGTAYCWGFQHDGLVARRQAEGYSFAGLLMGMVSACGLTAAGRIVCWRDGYWDLTGDLSGSFRSADASPTSWALNGFGGVAGWPELFGCGITMNQRAYCWGSNAYGQLGTTQPLDSCGAAPFGVFPCARQPVPVATELQFVHFTAGSGHACALTSAGEAYCWGQNQFGKLGNGTDTGPEQCQTIVGLDPFGPSPCSTTPVAVTGGLRFVSIAAGTDHTCGLSDGGQTYCWGRNDHGELGLGMVDTLRHSVPQLVAGAPTFVELGAGNFTCGRTESGDVYCWGEPLGRSPVLLPGGLRFTNLTVGVGHACGIPDGGRPHCWGRRFLGSVWAPPGTDPAVPLPIAGPLLPSS